MKDDADIAELYKKGLTQLQLKQKYKVGHSQIRKSLDRTKTSTAGKKSLFGPKNPSWKGGRIFRDGYVYLRLSGKYVPEHRYVMEQALGRPLEKKEVVHHKNGDGTDNRPENLLLFRNNGEHLGVELSGKCPKWTEDGLRRIHARSIPSMKGTRQCTKGTGVHLSRKKLIQEYRLETSELQNTGPEALLPQLPTYRRKKR
jgi:hypothetical protein